MRTNKTIKIFLSQYTTQVCMVVLFFLGPAVHSQVDIEAVARLHFQIASQPGQWFEGFESYKSGSYSPYKSHRSGMNRDSAFVVRTSGSEDVIEWSTSAIPPKTSWAPSSLRAPKGSRFSRGRSRNRYARSRSRQDH